MRKGLDAWHQVVRENNSGLLDEIVADDAVFYSPIVFKPQEGKAITVRYLTAANRVLNNGSFRYIGEWTALNSAVLEFVTEIDDIAINGADFITWNVEGKISEFKVMIRPLKAIDIVLRKMGEQLARMQG